MGKGCSQTQVNSLWRYKKN